jgi:hypothetical protein
MSRLQAKAVTGYPLRMKPLLFGDHRAYEGDNPWWTLRFVSPLSPKDKKVLSVLLEGANGLEASDWVEHTQCQVQLPTEPDFEDEEAWEAFYDQVDEVFDAVHAKFPLTAIFLQDGQFWGEEEELTELSNEELLQLIKNHKG